MTELVLSETRDRVAILTLNRPDKLNALNYALIDRLLSLLDLIETDDSVRAVILTGAGERAFSAGADIHEFWLSVAEGSDVALRDFVTRGQRLTARLEAFRKPVIAAVNGLAFGGGCEITEAVPLAIASDRALFAKPEVKLAMPPTFGGTQRLPRLAGRKRALELLLTGDAFSPARALELGLINQVVPHAQLMPAALDLARRIIGHSPAAVSAILTSVARGINHSIAEGLLVEAEQFARMAPTADLREGLSAWIERRKPSYDGTWTHVTRPAEVRRAARRLDRMPSGDMPDGRT
ncbi:crotonase/enoyl-CoA hydratase family protein [Mesorhizobium sp. VK25A]|uniref:Crotonase/enoyl-CoA hydratase family protein n=1 Tax=Mesorhizobium vachelliae TaxID=3072309 RepID=A0ABU5A9K6_9HYPH|nr:MULTISPECIES: crotonase/enoyl-CoA hydratase family protein [unclassified Mesorhizobium]MDX8534257.1 crotonase/enoyl-CoA hydratase family protein [Mesorhizobium sp. VK25D]MDX8546899.1 crotonase/enoyl-CoA hydratase family protein [Mesorhizobium sp. VK25A]